MTALFFALVYAGADWLNRKTPDYQAELADIEGQISRLNKDSSRQSGDGGQLVRWIYLLYLRASLTANPDHLQIAETEIDKAMRTLGPSEEFYLARANLNLKRHRLEAAKADLERLPDWTENPKTRALKADIDVQDGKYEEAGRACEDLVRHHRSWDNLARLAYLKAITGDVAGADALYAEAEEEITVKEMRAYAWIELQRGLLDLNHGRHEQALAHYLRADKAYSGYWMVEEYLAELAGAQRKYEEALTRFERVVSQAPRPELYQALGDLYLFMGKPEQAKPWHDKALEGYLESVRQGGVLYFHHLAAFYADVREDGPEAIRWARKDLDLRRNFAAYDALAWALYRNGQFAEALEQMNQALATGVRDARLYFHAAMIHLAAGQTDEGRQFLQRAAVINPRYEAFHVHR